MARRAGLQAAPRRRRGLTAALALSLLASCGHGPRRAPSATENTASRVALEQTADRPSLSLVERQGDPRAGLAMVIAHSLDTRGSVGIATLLSARLAAAGWPEVAVTAHSGSVVCTGLVDGAAGVRAAIGALGAALSEPVSTRETLPSSPSPAVSSGVATWENQAEAAVDSCVGQAGALRVDTPSPTARRSSARELERWRERCHAARSVAFGVVGERATVQAARAALAQLGPWPSGDPPSDPWPDSDQIGAHASAGGDATLSVALRLPSPVAAIAAARELSAADSALGARLSALTTPWRLDQIVATTRPRGACLRVDLGGETNQDASLVDAAKASALTLSEMQRAIAAAAQRPRADEEAVLRQVRPDDAAAAAAWRALASSAQQERPMRFVSFRGKAAAAEGASARFEEALAQAARGTARRTFETASRAERGQGHLWLLLASPCASAGEGRNDAGRLALLVRSLARTAPEPAVTLEPWVTVDGIGLLAHGPANGIDEPPQEHAARIARALGRALAGQRVPREALTRARMVTASELGPADRPLWWFALDTLSSQRPGWLEPRGTWSSLEMHAPHLVEARRHAFLREPLRLAVLANQDEEQVTTAVRTLERWLGRSPTELSACAEAELAAPQPGEYLLEQRAGAIEGPSAIVAVSIPSTLTHRLRDLGRSTLLLLNGSGGLLARAVVEPGLAAQARAALLGGARGAALVVEVHAHEQDSVTAVAQVRGLLERLAAGAATAAAHERAARALAAMDAEAELDPRWRLIGLWRGELEPAAADLRALRAFHRDIFAAERHVVVLSRAPR